MIRCSKSSLAFARTNKQTKLGMFIDEYKLVMEQVITLVWDMPNVPTLIPKEITSQVKSWLTARAIQCAAKQASGIVRGTQKKQKKRAYRIKKLVESKQFKKAKKLQREYDETSVSKPKLDRVEAELDSRFVKIEFKDKEHFDGWVTLTCLGDIPTGTDTVEKLKFQLPFKKHKHFNSMLERGTIKSGIRLSKTMITFNFDIPDKELKEDGKTIGIDIGQNTTIACSDGQTIDSDKHGHNFRTICDKLARRKKDSNGFRRAVAHRTNYINWSVKQMNLDDISVVNRENIKYLRKGKKTKRSLSHWTYGEFFGKLDSKLNDAGVQVVKLDPAYTSQRCSSCGWVHEGNRRKKKFVCKKCGHRADSDGNASINISLSLQPLKSEVWRNKLNLKGFYWFEVGREPIVRAPPKTN